MNENEKYENSLKECKEIEKVFQKALLSLSGKTAYNIAVVMERFLKQITQQSVLQDGCQFL
jgi:hypothetical protein